jgi:CheY-like chemotaxis protein
MINLAQNAIRYTPNGKVLLSVRRRAGDWLIEVWDTGIGIADDEKATLFDPYVRSEKASHMDIAGHGLGLAVVARCARMMRAQYGFHSRLNKGSRFWLRLQAVNTQTSEEPAIGDLIPNRLSPLATRTPACAGVGQCLVIDDDHAVLIAWRTLLESWGLRVRTATNGFEANRILELGFAPQAIFCDHRLRKNESGFALLKSLLDRCPNASGAMVSGELASVELIEAEDQGYLVIKKPASAATLHGMLCTWGLAHQSPSGVEHPLNGGHT